MSNEKEEKMISKFNFMIEIDGDRAILDTYVGHHSHLTIPAHVQSDGKTYTVSVGDLAFAHNDYIKSVRFMPGVKAATSICGLFEYCNR
jgi:hypothetical protein